MPPAKRAQTYGTAKEVAAYLRKSEGTLANQRSQGTGPPYVKAGEGKFSRVLYKWAEVERWLDAQAVTPGQTA